MNMQMKKQDLVDRRFSNDKTQLKILAMLFKTCNGSCPFCFQREFHGTMPTADDFKKNWKNTLALLEDCIQQNIGKYEEMSISLMGGEMFLDDPELDNIILEFIKALSKYKIEARITSNLLCKDLTGYKNAIKLLNDLKMDYNVHTSFDFGPLRFHKDEMLHRFKTNVYEILDYLKSFNKKLVTEVIRTKYMLNQLKYSNEYRDIFAFLVNNGDVCLNQLVGEFDYALTYEESIELWKLLFTEYKNISDLPTHLYGAGRNCLNIQRLVLVNDTLYYGCVAQRYSLESVPTSWKKEHSKAYMQKYSCIACKYFNNCPMKCPIERQYDKCDIKEVKEWIEQNNIQL